MSKLFIDLPKYEDYLPQAFDESMSLLQKMNKIIQQLHNLGHLTSDMIVKWNEVYEWVMGEGLEKEVIDKLEIWLQDGTLEKIINEKLFANLLAMMEELKTTVEKRLTPLEKIEFEFDFTQAPVQYITDLGGKRNAVNQSVNIDPTTNHIYVTQADSKTPEGFVITQCSPTGAYMSHMHVPEGGHGTMIGLDRRSGGNLKIWVYHSGANKLILFDYKPNSVLDMNTVQNLPNYHPYSLNGSYYTVTLDHYHDLIVFRLENGLVQTRKRGDVLLFQDTIVNQIQVDFQHTNDSYWFQGCTTYGKDLYWMSGSSEPSDPVRITKYDMETGQKQHIRQLTDIIAQDGTFLFRDNFKEPEGITYFVDPNGKHHLMFVLTVGGGNKRTHHLYDIAQRDGAEHWTHVMRTGSSNYRFMRSDGRALSKRETDTQLIDILTPGYYYLTAADISTMDDFPYVKKGNWFLLVTPTQTHFNTHQFIMRADYQEPPVIMVRMVEMTGETGTPKKAGRWNRILVGGDMEYALASDFGNKLSNITIAGEFYVTSGQASEFTDTPVSGFGYRLTNSNEALDGSIIQTVELNSETFRLYKRLVNPSTGEVKEWRRYEFTPSGG